jgi:hypothetical protein
MRSNRRIMRSAMVEVLESKTATKGERLQACKLLLKIMALSPKRKPRNKAPKGDTAATKRRRTLDHILEQIQ